MRRALFLVILASCAERAPAISTTTTTTSATPTASATTTPTAITTPPAPHPAGSWPAQPVPTDAPRVYARTRHVPIFVEPRTDSKTLGHLGVGGSVRLRSAEPIVNKKGGCAKFFAIEPRG